MSPSLNFSLFSIPEFWFGTPLNPGPFLGTSYNHGPSNTFGPLYSQCLRFLPSQNSPSCNNYHSSDGSPVLQPEPVHVQYRRSLSFEHTEPSRPSSTVSNQTSRRFLFTSQHISKSLIASKFRLDIQTINFIR